MSYMVDFTRDFQNDDVKASYTVSIRITFMDMDFYRWMLQQSMEKELFVGYRAKGFIGSLMTGSKINVFVKPNFNAVTSQLGYEDTKQFKILPSLFNDEEVFTFQSKKQAIDFFRKMPEVLGKCLSNMEKQFKAASAS
ncbi:hypothetical protein [Brevibacillus brevis]|uniref:Uncharacterized protein n=1 Tax=Brevibacillus brevis TaxID=1393 RepID=A0ABY9TCX1_BREBE|nr:hypothetical protein [Brevibacillus brevis]WNC17941.1 hypothetical protein RGB73_30260 [Brevibacillus brevis]